jgi:hypothetical protein
MKDNNLPFGNAASSPPAPLFEAAEEKFESFVLGEEEIESDAAPVSVAAKKLSLGDIPIPEPELINFPASLREALGNATNEQIAEAYRRLHRLLKVIVGHRFGFIVVNSLSSILLDFMPPGIASATDFEGRKLDDALRDMKRSIRDMVFSQQDEGSSVSGVLRGDLRSPRKRQERPVPVKPVFVGDKAVSQTKAGPADDVLEAGLDCPEAPEREECPVVPRNEDVLFDVSAEKEGEEPAEPVEDLLAVVTPPEASFVPPPVKELEVLATESGDDEEYSVIPWINRVLTLDLESLDAIEALLLDVPPSLLSNVLGEAAFFYQTYRAIALLLKQPPVRGVSFNKLQARVFLTMLAEDPLETKAVAEKFSGGNAVPVYSARSTALEKMKKIGQETLKAGVKTEDYIQGLLDQKAAGFSKSPKPLAIKKPGEAKRKYKTRRLVQERIPEPPAVTEIIVPAVSLDIPDVETQEVPVAGRIVMPDEISWPEDFRARLKPYDNASPEDLWAVFAKFTNLEQKALNFEYALNYPVVNEVDMEAFVRDEAGFGKVIARLINTMRVGLGYLAEEQEEKCPVSPVLLPAQKLVPLESGRKLGVRCRFSDFVSSDQFRKTVASGIIPPVSDKELERAFYEAPISDFQRSSVVCVYCVAQPAVTRRDLDKIKGKKKKSAEEIARKACREMRGFILESRETKVRQIKEPPFSFTGKQCGFPSADEALEFLNRPVDKPAGVFPPMATAEPASVDALGDELPESLVADGATAASESHEINTAPEVDLMPGVARENGAPEVFGAEKQKQSWIDQVREAKRFDDFRDPASIQLYLSQLDFGRIKNALGNLVALTDVSQLMPLFQYPPEIAHSFSSTEQMVFLLSFGKVELKPAEIARESDKKKSLVYAARFLALKKAKEFLADPEAAIKKNGQVRVKKTPSVKAEPKCVCQPRHPIKDNNEARQAAWLNRVFSTDLQNEQAVRTLLWEVSFERLKALLGFSEKNLQSAEDAFPIFLQLAGWQGFLTPYQTGICFACIGPVAIRTKKIAIWTSAANVEAVSRAKFAAKQKFNRLAKLMAENGVDLHQAMESSVWGGKRSSPNTAGALGELKQLKPFLSESLEMARDVWTDRLLASLEIYLGELSGLLVHPAQLAPVLRFNNLGISKDVFLLFFDSSNPKEVVEIAESLGRSQDAVSAAKGRVLHRLGEKLRKALPASKQEEVYSVALTGFDAAGYVARLQKQAESRLDESQPKAPASERMAKWLETFSDEGLKRLASAIVAELKGRDLTDWLLEEMGPSVVDKPTIALPIQEVHTPKPVCKPLPKKVPEPDSLGSLEPSVVPAAISNLTERLFKSEAFKERLVVLISRETLLVQLAHLYEKRRNEFDALQLYFSSANGNTRTYKEVTELLWKKGYGGSSAIGRDWVKIGLRVIRNRASGMEG